MKILQLVSIFLCIHKLTAAYDDLNRVVGGHYTKIAKFPFLVSIRYDGNHVCGGTIITRNFVVTAAHCIDMTNEEAMIFLTIDFGSTFANEITMNLYNIAQIFQPSTAPEENDIGLIKILGKFRFGRNVQPHPNLAPSDLEVPDGATVRIVGWGHTKRKARNVVELKTANVQIANFGYCKYFYESSNIYNNITENMMCAGQPEGESDACQGDSGGPLLYKDTLVGIVSFGYGCARPYSPGVYTKISYYLNWIMDTIAYN